MKKLPLTIIIAACVMASCSTDETLEVNRGDAIGMSAAMATRTADITVSSLYNIYVTAINSNDNSIYFENVLFNRTATTDPFTSATSYYWLAYNLKFYSYALAGGTTEKKLIAYKAATDSPSQSPATWESGSDVSRDNPITYDSSKNPQIADFYQPINMADQYDFIVGGHVVAKSGTPAITFNHALTKITIKAKCGNTNRVVKVKAVAIAGIISEGTFTFNSTTGETGSWELATEDSEQARTDERSEMQTVRRYFNIFSEDSDTTKIVTLGSEAANLTTDGIKILPQNIVGWPIVDYYGYSNPSTYDTDLIKHDNLHGYTYLLFKVNVTDYGRQIYPYNAGDGEEYDWLAVPIHDNEVYQYEVGKQYTYTVDFSNGLGYVDPIKDEPTGDDPFNPGDKITNRAILVSYTGSNWVNDSSDNNMDMKYPNPDNNSSTSSVR